MQVFYLLYKTEEVFVLMEEIKRQRYRSCRALKNFFTTPFNKLIVVCSLFIINVLGKIAPDNILNFKALSKMVADNILTFY